jgi:hypothetical protein
MHAHDIRSEGSHFAEVAGDRIPFIVPVILDETRLVVAIVS